MRGLLARAAREFTVETKKETGPQTQIMKTKRRTFLNGTLPALVSALAFTMAARTSHAQETRFDKLANLPFAEGRPTQATAQTLRDELLFQRATETYLWAMPLINTLGMQVGSEKRSAPATTSCPSGSSDSAPRPW